MSTPPADFTILEDDLSGAKIQALLELHARGMLEASPPDTCHFFDVEALRAPAVTVWSMWEGEALAGCGALHEIEPRHGEVKAMRTDEAFLGRGVGRLMLKHILEIGRERGYTRISLETGNTPPFAAAHRLYQSEGFVACGPFGSYDGGDPDFNRYYTLELWP